MGPLTRVENDGVLDVDDAIDALIEGCLFRGDDEIDATEIADLLVANGGYSEAAANAAIQASINWGAIT